MNNNKEKILEWLNSSEAKAGKLEQEAKDLRKKIQVIKCKMLGCKEELAHKLSQVDQVEKQLEVAEIGITRRRSKMMTLHERSDVKLERLRNAKLQLAMLDENNKRNSFNEDLESFEIPYKPSKVEERAQLGFADILKLSQKAPKQPKPSLANKQNKEKSCNMTKRGDYEKAFEEFKKIKESLEVQKMKIEQKAKQSKKRVELVGGKLLKERQAVNCIQEQVTNLCFDD
eukprot:GFUD01067648.1.p1 GENE.GFUD01067648.1~~GFUD01067648.1.p1  ORF type:complete len:229 (+),score=88.49 GFUD01067648.1:64-750(+)